MFAFFTQNDIPGTCRYLLKKSVYENQKPK